MVAEQDLSLYSDGRKSKIMRKSRFGAQTNFISLCAKLSTDYSIISFVIFYTIFYVLDVLQQFSSYLRHVRTVIHVRNSANLSTAPLREIYNISYFFLTSLA